MRAFVSGTNGKLVSYFKEYVKEKKQDWKFDFVSLRNNSWTESDFSQYDTVIHLAGVSAVPDDNYDEFYRINVDLTKRLFEKAVSCKVSHFAYLSSMAVYDGIGWGFGKQGLIQKETKPIQKSNYGRSKFEAEEILRKIEQNNTTVSIIRAPAIVGGGIENYFDRYIKISKIPVIPMPWIHIEAKRSFVYVDSLIELILKIIRDNRGGVFFPQQFPPLSVSEMLEDVCRAKGQNRRKSAIIGRMIPFGVQKKFFSQICYDKSISDSWFETEISSHEAIIQVIRGK